MPSYVTCPKCKTGLLPPSGKYDGFYVAYRLSESHNEAMTRGTQRWSGYSNPYISDNPENTGEGGEETGYCTQFDIYSAVEPVSPWDLY